MKNLYSYNQLKTCYGENDEQVKAIKKYLEKGLYCTENKTLKAFKRIV